MSDFFDSFKNLSNELGSNGDMSGPFDPDETKVEVNTVDVHGREVTLSTRFTPDHGYETAVFVDDETPVPFGWHSEEGEARNRHNNWLQAIENMEEVQGLSWQTSEDLANYLSDGDYL